MSDVHNIFDGVGHAIKVDQVNAAVKQFGSLEEYVAVKDQYVMEESEWGWHFRLKTDAERAREQADDILAKRAPLGVCVVCAKDVYKATPHEATPYGLFHEGCLDGKPENERRQWPEDY